MTFRLESRDGLWWAADSKNEVGGVFVDLRAAVAFVRQCDAHAKLVVRGGREARS